ncbi:hypothetical protein V1504DRAFT_440703 [Lipomyces starkeyi]
MAYRTHQTRREEEDDVVVVVLSLALLASLKVSRNRCYLTRLAWDLLTITRPDVSDNGEARSWRRSIDADVREIFGIVPSVCTRYIRRGLEILLEILRARHPMLRKGFGFVDGLHLPFTSNVFSPLGTILHATSMPPVVSTTQLSHALYQKIAISTEHGYWLIADPAFPTTNAFSTHPAEV